MHRALRSGWTGAREVAGEGSHTHRAYVDVRSHWTSAAVHARSSDDWRNTRTL